MRNAALILGILGGLLAMLVGFFHLGKIEFVQAFGEVDGIVEQAENVGLIRVISFLGPVMAIAGAAMSPMRALWGGLLLLVSGGAMLYAFGLSIYTIFPIGMTICAGFFAIAAGKPDEPKAHF